MLIQAFLQPLLYYLLFVPMIGKSIGTILVADGISVAYPIYVLPGMIIFNAFTSSQYTGITTYIDQLSGELEILFSLPISRSTLLVGKMFFACTRTLVESFILVLIGSIITGHSLNLTVGRSLFLIIISFVFASISVLIFTSLSSIIKSQDAFNVIVNIITLPLVFTSSVFYPLGNFPSYLSILARINPLTFFSGLMRQIMFGLEINIVPNIVFLSLVTILVFKTSSYCFNRNLS